MRHLGNCGGGICECWRWSLDQRLGRLGFPNDPHQVCDGGRTFTLPPVSCAQGTKVVITNTGPGPGYVVPSQQDIIGFPGPAIGQTVEVVFDGGQWRQQVVNPSPPSPRRPINVAQVKPWVSRRASV